MGEEIQDNNKAILIACSNPPDKGKGISTYSKLIADEFVKKGYIVHYLCPKTDNFSGFESNKIIPVFFEPYADPIEQTKLIQSSIEKIDNLCGIINNDVIFVQALAPVLKVPLLSVMHLDNFSIGKAALVNKAYIDYVIAISYDMYKALVKKRIEPLKCALVLNGIPPNTSAVDLKFDRLKMMAGVEFSARKGGHSLLKLLRRLKASKMNFSFVWFGHVPNKVSAEFLDDSRFEFYQQLPRDEYLARVKESNIFLFPSKEEGCPMSLKEAMSEGLVPIAADGIGAMKQIIQNGIDGYLLDVKNWDFKAYQLLEQFETRPDSLASMSKQAKNKIMNNFTVASVADNLEGLLSRPTVDRNNIDSQDIEYYKWHRLPLDFSKESLTDYWNLVKYIFGILLKVR